MPVRRGMPKPAGQCGTCHGKGYTEKKWWAPPWRGGFRTQVLCRKCNGSGTKTPRRLFG